MGKRTMSSLQTFSQHPHKILKVGPAPKKRAGINLIFKNALLGFRIKKRSTKRMG